MQHNLIEGQEEWAGESGMAAVPQRREAIGSFDGSPNSGRRRSDATSLVSTHPER